MVLESAEAAGETANAERQKHVKRSSFCGQKETAHALSWKSIVAQKTARAAHPC